MKRTLAVLISTLALFAYGCAGGGGTHTASDSSGSVVLPDGFSYDSLEVVSLNEIAQVDRAGRFDVKLPDNMVSFVMVRDSVSEAPVYYGYFFPEGMGTGALDQFLINGGNIQIDDASTALALTMINPLFFASTLDQKAENAEKIITHEKFPELVNAIATAREKDFFSTLSNEANHDLFVQAKDLAVAALADNADSHVPRAVQEQKIVYNKNMAWPETAGANKINFKNPKFVYYAAAAFNGPDQLQDAILINPKTEIINFSIWPPSFEIVDTKNTVGVVTAGSNTLKIFKGIMINATPEAIWGTQAARVALLANIWLTIQMTVSLCGDIGILPGGSVGVDLLFAAIENIPAEWIYSLFQAIKGKDILGVIDLFVDFFKANASVIADQISGAFSSGSSDPAAASSLVNQASSLTGIATGLFDVVNSEVPFFYDLIDSSELGKYDIVNGVVQDNAPDDAKDDSGSCSSTPTSTNSSLFLLLLLAPLAIFAVRRRVVA